MPDGAPQPVPCLIVLYEPEIAPNAGNIMRLCANTGAQLHLLAPLGFRLDDRRLRRAGMDYRELAAVTVHRTWAACREALAGHRLFAVTTRGNRRYDAPGYEAGDGFVFGPESRGLPENVLAEFGSERRVRIPMATATRSLNLANAAAVMVYEVWRQLGFAGAANREGPDAPL